jgi:hypothetical protein
VAEVNSKESRVGREVGGYCEGQEGNGASPWQLRGDNSGQDTRPWASVGRWQAGPATQTLL